MQKPELGAGYETLAGKTHWIYYELTNPSGPLRRTLPGSDGERRHRSSKGDTTPVGLVGLVFIPSSENRNSFGHQPSYELLGLDQYLSSTTAPHLHHCDTSESVKPNFLYAAETKGPGVVPSPDLNKVSLHKISSKHAHRARPYPPGNLS